jgi:tetratricopeptide (TPR) repeat protein
LATVTAGHHPRRLAAPLVLFLVALAAASVRATSFSELVKRGFEMLQGGRFEEAAESFGEALKVEPSSEPARKGLAEAWASLGIAQLHAGRLRQSRDSLEKAVAARPESAGYRVLLAQVLFREGDLRAARRETDEALGLDPANAAARELSGDLYDKESRLNLALAEWEAAAAAGASPALGGKIDRARREMAVEEGMGREVSRFFVILYDRDVSRALIQGILELLDRAFNTLHDRLGEYPRDEIKVILYSQTAYRDVTQAPDWSGGSYDGKIRIPVGGLKTAGEAAGLQNILVHEMTHAFLFRMAPLGLPLWFEEGLATAFQGWDPVKTRAWLAEHPTNGLATLDDVDRTLRGRGGNVTAGYAAARLAVNDLEEIRGFGAVRRIVAGVGAGEPFEEVFRDEMRMEVAEFQDRWRRGLP